MEPQMLRGSLELLILSRIKKQETYGGQILKDILVDSNEALELSEGTLYSLLKRLEKKDLVSSYWGESDLGARRKYYKITEEGKKVYESKLINWRLLDKLIQGR